MNTEAFAAADPLLTLNQAGERVGVSRATIERHIRRRRLCAVKLGHLTRIRESDLRRFLENLPPADYRPMTGCAA